MLSSVFIFRENDVYDDIDAASGTSFFPPKLNVLLFNASWSSIKKMDTLCVIIIANEYKFDEFIVYLFV